MLNFCLTEPINSQGILLLPFLGDAKNPHSSYIPMQHQSTLLKSISIKGKFKVVPSFNEKLIKHQNNSHIYWNAQQFPCEHPPQRMECEIVIATSSSMVRISSIQYSLQQCSAMKEFTQLINIVNGNG